jgi:hypothetical protein
VYISAGGGQLEQDRLDPDDSFPLPSDHKTSPVSGAVYPAAPAQIDEVAALLFEPPLPPDRIAPVRIPASEPDDVAETKKDGRVIGQAGPDDL